MTERPRDAVGTRTESGSGIKTTTVSIAGAATEVVAGHATKKHNTRNPVKNYLIRRFDQMVLRLLAQFDVPRVLEIGCGSGHIVKLIKHTIPSCHYTAVDIDEELLAMARANGADDCLLSEGEPLRLPLDDESFDIVLMLEVLEHLHQPAAALEEARRLTKSLAIFSVPNEPTWRVLNMMMMRHVKDLGNTPGHINHWGSQSFRALITGGFDIIQYPKPFPWLMVTVRKRVAS